jgi:hypothetical protein
MDQSLVLAPGKYRPMERLVLEEDFRFLSSQPGFSARLGRRFRTERRRVFRAYLRSLSMDFGRVSKACQMLVIHAAEDRGDLAKGIIRQRLLFALGIFAVEAHAAHTAVLALWMSMAWWNRWRRCSPDTGAAYATGRNGTDVVFINWLIR